MAISIRTPTRHLKSVSLLLLVVASSCQPSSGKIGVPESELATVEVPVAGTAAAPIRGTLASSQGSPLAPFMDRAREMAGALSDRELAGQLIMTGVDGTGRMTGPSRQLVADLLPGAILDRKSTRLNSSH